MQKNCTTGHKYEKSLISQNLNSSYDHDHTHFGQPDLDALSLITTQDLWGDLANLETGFVQTRVVRPLIFSNRITVRKMTG